MNAPYTVHYVSGNQGIIAHLFGAPSWDQWEVIDPDGNIVASCMSASEANELCWRYNLDLSRRTD